jgi:hypothetical protein
MWSFKTTDTSLRLIINRSSYIQNQALIPLQGFCQQKLADMAQLYERSFSILRTVSQSRSWTLFEGFLASIIFSTPSRYGRITPVSRGSLALHLCRVLDWRSWCRRLMHERRRYLRCLLRASLSDLVMKPARHCMWHQTLAQNSGSHLSTCSKFEQEHSWILAVFDHVMITANCGHLRHYLRSSAICLGELETFRHCSEVLARRPHHKVRPKMLHPISRRPWVDSILLAWLFVCSSFSAH